MNLIKKSFDIFGKTNPRYSEEPGLQAMSGIAIS